MKRILMIALLAALPLAAQEKRPEAETQKMVQKLFILKYVDPRAVEPLLRVFGQAVPNAELHAIAVTASSQNMPAIEEAITRLDTPPAAPKNIDLTFYFLIGTEGDGGQGAALPKDLDSVVTQLKNTFPFKNYRLMDVLTARSRTGRNVDVSSIGGSITSTTTEPVQTKLHINSVSIGGDGSTIRIDGLKTNSFVPYSTDLGSNMRDLGLSTDVDMKEGQKVVVGRVGLSRDQALFVVLTGKILN